MNLDEFAFFNQQLAGMLKTGIPLESSLRHLCVEMRTGSLRHELEALEKDLSNGTALAEAISKRKFPPLYVAMIRLGVAGNSLPGVLILLADYYHRANSVWLRLKTLLVYPAIVLLASLLLSIAMAVIYGFVTRGTADALGEVVISAKAGNLLMAVKLWYPTVIIGLLFSLFAAIWIIPSVRQWLRWRAPGFKEASLSQIAAAMAMMLQNGSTVGRSLEFAAQLEAGSPAQRELNRWHSRLAEGRTQFADLTAGAKIFPPLFLWLVSASGEDWVGGFRNAAEVYYQRSVYKVELMLYAVFPVTVFALGILIVTQVIPVGRSILSPMVQMWDVGSE